jgi:coproporphyrinogen III oxidase
MDLERRTKEHFAELQGRICARLAAFEPEPHHRFLEDAWEHGSAPESGGGVTRVLSGGRVFEKAGVSLAGVGGSLSPRLAEKLDVEPQPFFATGLSLVIHPLSPFVPAAHMNLRYIALRGQGSVKGGRRAWFGGGADLTPYYLFPEDASTFHAALREACARHDPTYYPGFKRWCDEYFFLPHRGETRGVGGIFFDYLEGDLEAIFAFVRDVGEAFLAAYPSIVERRQSLPWYERERQWQLIRRGRYVEFNLMQDRGTLFGLETRGRTESILMSLPPLVRWTYGHRPEPGSREEELVEALRHPRDWIAPPSQGESRRSFVDTAEDPG